jgi:hypothetical protein
MAVASPANRILQPPGSGEKVTTMVDRTEGLDVGPGFGLGDINIDIKERALELGAMAREQFSARSKALTVLIVNRPAQALGVALGMGVLLGWLIKRR